MATANAMTLPESKPAITASPASTGGAVPRNDSRRHRFLGAPLFLAVCRIERAQAAVDGAHEDALAGHERRREHFAADLRLPELLAGGGFERDDVAVVRADHDQAAADAGPADKFELRLGCASARGRWPDRAPRTSPSRDAA